jgi:hypothetical protein
MAARPHSRDFLVLRLREVRLPLLRGARRVEHGSRRLNQSHHTILARRRTDLLGRTQRCVQRVLPLAEGAAQLGQRDVL